MICRPSRRADGDFRTLDLAGFVDVIDAVVERGLATRG
jgi:hypothetical protein